MSEPIKNTPTADGTAKAGEKKLGLSRFIYATGNSVKDGLIWGSAATLALIAAIGFGKARSMNTREANIFSEVAGIIETGHTESKKWLGRQFAKLWGEQKEGKKIFDITGAEVGASLVAGGLLGHIIQIPGFHKGWKKAQVAADKYDTLVNEKDKLVEANAILIEQNQQYKTQIAKKEGSFTDQLQQQAADAATATAQGVVR